jgi:uncharacterized delta-60 repeat protein
MLNWIKRRKTTSKLSGRKGHRQDRPKPSSFRPHLEPLEKRELLYAGALDQAFGVHGIVLDSTFSNPSGGAVALQADGRILVVGTTYSTTTRRDFVLERFNSDGSPDASFGAGGTVRTDLTTGSDDLANCIGLQADGKILVAGRSQLSGATYASSVIVRYNTDGTLDTTFNGGIVFDNFADIAPPGDVEIKGIALQADGEIVVAGDYFRRLTTLDREFASARYNPDGTLDTTFGTQISIGPFTIGTGEVLTDFNFSSGTHDSEANSVAIQSDGRIVAAGFAFASSGPGGFALARYYADGTLDPDFQGGGKVVTSLPPSFAPLIGAVANSMAIQSDGKIVAAGTGSGPGGFSKFLLARYNLDGSLDAGFGIGGLVNTQFPSSTDDFATGLALQADGKIVVAGNSVSPEVPLNIGIGLARYNSDGKLDKSFSFDGLVTTGPGLRLSETAGMAIQADGKIVAAGVVAPDPSGTTSFFLTRYLGDAGQLSFSTAASSVSESGRTILPPPINIITEGGGGIILPIAGYGNTAILTVNRTGGATGTVTVDYATSDGTASAGADYIATTGTLTFLDGETSKTISIPILDDGTLEGGSETFSVTLSNPTGGATLGTVAKTVVTIKDDDVIGSPVSGTEGVPFTGVVATFAPSNPSVGAGDYVALIDWGDGTPDAHDITPGTITQIGTGRFSVTGTHTYAEEGTYPLAVHISGAGTMDTSNPFVATVNDAPLKATAVNFAVTGHKSFSGAVATFTDVDPGGVATDYTATITWDDGTTSTGTIGGTGPFTVSGSHVFGAFTGIHNVSVTISDTDAPVSVTDKVKDPLAPSVAWGSWSPSVNWTNVQTGDFDGDGKADVIGRDPATGQWWVGLSTGSGFNTTMWGKWSPAVTWVDVKVGDFNGDGKADIAGRVQGTGQWWVSLSTGSSFTNSLWTTWSTGVHWVDVQVGDFTGDGKADLVGRAKETGQWWVAQSTGNSFTNSLWATWNPAATWVDVNVGDFNGDGKADLTGRYLQGGSWWTAISTGASFTTSLWANWSTAATWVDVKVGDFNGDGKADITGRYLQGGSWWTAISTGSSFTTSLWTIWSTGVTWVDVKVGDFTRDGKADLVGRAKESGQWWVAQSSGSSFANSLWATWSTGVTWADVQIGDFEGDGTAQITGRALSMGQWWMGL